MRKKRNAIPALKQKQLLQEANSQCPFCGDRDVSAIEFHHMDNDPSNNDLGNLIIVCSSCHSRITKGVISEADVFTKKRELYWTSQSRLKDSQAKFNVNITSSTFHGDIAQNIIKISGMKAPRLVHPPGSIGANLAMKGYVDYLVRRYFDYRKADRSYGRNKNFSHAVLHKNIEREFGAKTFFLPEYTCIKLVEYLTRHIDNTIQGKKNRSMGIPNYHDFETHCEKYRF